MIAGSEPPAAFVAALEDDLNTPGALAELFDLARQLNKADDDAHRQSLASELRAAGQLLGLLGKPAKDWFEWQAEVSVDAIDTDGFSSAQIDALIAARATAKKIRDFGEADRIRDLLKAAGVLIEDSAQGTRWRRG